MAKKLFVGSLDWGTSEDELKNVFSQFGEVTDHVILKDHLGRSKGFGFVTFENDEDADKAIAALDGSQLGKRNIVVNEAKPPKPRRDEW